VRWRLAADVVASVPARAMVQPERVRDVGRSAWVQNVERRRSLSRTMRSKGRHGGRGGEEILWIPSSVNCAGCVAELWI
jgi:hypothetical protein